MNRRELITGAAALSAAVAAGASRSAPADRIAPPPRAAVAAAADQGQIARKGYSVQELRDGLYWLADGAYDTMFLVSDAGVIAVDPLPTIGAKYLQAVAEVTDRPVTHIVYSHAHTDHIGGAALFPAGAAIVAHRDTAATLARLKDPRRPLPTRTFDTGLTLTVGGQSLQLDYKGINHDAGNIFIHAPRQRVLMLVDVIYPGYAPYPDLGIAIDVAGYAQAHRDALAYDFDVLVAGHVDRLGTREDVQTSLEFVSDLQAVSAAELAALPFPAFLKTVPAGNRWFLHDDYEAELVRRCHAELLPRWKDRLAGLERSLESHCRTMIVAQVVQLPPASPH
jgi:glyoxylase-like metal-dependent hydrolase (beta-lactamase superfamily II)